MALEGSDPSIILGIKPADTAGSFQQGMDTAQKLVEAKKAGQDQQRQKAVNNILKDADLSSEEGINAAVEKVKKIDPKAALDLQKTGLDHQKLRLSLEEQHQNLDDKQLDFGIKINGAMNNAAQELKDYRKSLPDDMPNAKKSELTKQYLVGEAKKYNIPPDKFQEMFKGLGLNPDDPDFDAHLSTRAKYSDLQQKSLEAERKARDDGRDDKLEKFYKDNPDTPTTAAGLRQRASKLNAIGGKEAREEAKQLETQARDQERDREQNAREDRIERQNAPPKPPTTVDPATFKSAVANVRAALPQNFRTKANIQQQEDTIATIMTEHPELKTGKDVADYMVRTQGNAKGAQATDVAFDKGKQGDTVRSLNVGVQHLKTIDQAIDKLDNIDERTLNGVWQGVVKEFGGTQASNLGADAQIVAGEINKATGGSVSVTEIEHVKDLFNKANSKDQLHEAVGEFRKLMGGQLKGLRKQYTSSGAGSEEDFNKKLDDETQKALKDSNSKGKVGGSLLNDYATKHGISKDDARKILLKAGYEVE